MLRVEGLPGEGEGRALRRWQRLREDRQLALVGHPHVGVTVRAEGKRVLEKLFTLLTVVKRFVLPGGS